MRPIEVIHLSYRDTIDTASELLKRATPGAQVWLVAPWRLRLTRKLINLRRLKRMADNSALDLRLVSRHLETRTLAREAGVLVRSFVPLKLRRYRLARSRVNAGLQARITPVRERLGRRWERRPRRVSVGAAFLFLLVTIFLVVVLVGTVVLLVPTVSITLRPVAGPVYASFSVTASPLYREIDYGRAIVPARMVQVIVEGHGDTPATGRIDVPDEHASGQVVFANKTDSSVRVPKGTIVRTSSGVNVRFYTVADVELPARLYGNTRVGIIAMDSGPTSNVKALTINVVEGEVARLVEVLNDAPTGGGTLKRAAVVDYKDFDRLRADMVSRLQRDAYEQLVAELEEGESVPPNSLDVQVMSQYFDQVVDQRSDVLSMQMEVVARGIAVDDASIRALATQLLERQGEGESRLIEDSLVIRRSEQVDAEGREVRFDVAARGMVASVIDTDRIKTAIRGKEIAPVAEWLSENLELETEPQIVVFPEGWEWIPLLPGRVQITISSGES